VRIERGVKGGSRVVLWRGCIASWGSMRIVREETSLLGISEAHRDITEAGSKRRGEKGPKLSYYSRSASRSEGVNIS